MSDPIQPRIIAFEGVDGAGKSTVILRVAEFLRDRGERVFLPRSGKEHDSIPARKIRRLTRDPKNVDLSPRAEFSLYCAREAQVMDELVGPAVARGETVLLDRSILTPVLLASHGRGLDRDRCEKWADEAVDGRLPDLTLIFDVHPRTSRIRKRLEKIRNHASRDPGRKGLAGSGLKERLRDGYRLVAEARAYPLFHVERITPDTLAERVIDTLRGKPPHNDPSDSVPTWVVDKHLSFEQALDTVSPLVALYFSRGLVAGRAVRKRLLEDEPQLVAWSLDADDPLRAEAAVAEPYYALAGLARSELTDKDLRARYLEQDGPAVARALKFVDDRGADELRQQLIPEWAGAVVESLIGREDPWAESVRDAHWKQADIHQRAVSLAYCKGSRAQVLRAGVFEKIPSLGLGSLRGVPAEQADPWLRRYAARAPKSVIRALVGRTDAFAHQLRRDLLETGREVIDSIRGLGDEGSWELRRHCLERWPSTVLWSLAGVPDDGRRREMIAACTELGRGDLHFLRRLHALETYDREPTNRRIRAFLAEDE